MPDIASYHQCDQTLVIYGDGHWAPDRHLRGRTSHNEPGHQHSLLPGYHQIKWSSQPLFVSDLTNSYILNVLERQENGRQREIFDLSGIVINSGCNVDFAIIHHLLY